VIWQNKRSLPIHQKLVQKFVNFMQNLPEFMTADPEGNPAFAGAIDHGRYNPSHLHVSRMYPNANLELGASHWSYGTLHTLQSRRLGEVLQCLPWAAGRDAEVRHQSAEAGECGSRGGEFTIVSVLQGRPHVLDLWDIVLDRGTLVPALVTSAVPSTAWRQFPHPLFACTGCSPRSRTRTHTA
jgi:hypothetical protein